MSNILQKFGVSIADFGKWLATAVEILFTWPKRWSKISKRRSLLNSPS